MENGGLYRNWMLNYAFQVQKSKSDNLPYFISSYGNFEFAIDKNQVLAQFLMKFDLNTPLFAYNYSTNSFDQGEVWNYTKLELYNSKAFQFPNHDLEVNHIYLLSEISEATVIF